MVKACIDFSDVVEAVTTLDIHWNLINTEGAKHLADALKINQVRTIIDIGSLYRFG